MEKNNREEREITFMLYNYPILDQIIENRRQELIDTGGYEMAESRGPVAPKDPTAKRPFYYVMRDKEVCPLLTPDGKAITFIIQLLW